MKILRFTATWCNPCKALAQTLEDISLPCPMMVIDVDQNQEMANKFMVRSVPTLIAVEDNNEVIAVMNGVKTKQQIEAWLKSL